MPAFPVQKTDFCQKFTRYLTQNENARFTKCQNQWTQSDPIFRLHSTVCPAAGLQLHTVTTNQNKDERCYMLTLHRFTRFSPFFFLWFGRSGSKARSLLETKLLIRKLLHGRRWSHEAWQIITRKTTNTPTNKTQRFHLEPRMRNIPVF